MLGDKITHYEQTHEMLKNTPAQYNEEFPWLKEVDSLALANAITFAVMSDSISEWICRVNLSMQHFHNDLIV